MKNNTQPKSEKYIEIKNLINPEKSFIILENQLIDIIYPDHIKENSIVALLDTNINPEIEDDISWLTKIIHETLENIGEISCTIISFDK